MKKKSPDAVEAAGNVTDSPAHQENIPDARSTNAGLGKGAANEPGCAGGTGSASSASVPEDRHRATEPSGYIPAQHALTRIRSSMVDIFQRAAGKVDSGELGLIGWGLAQPRVQQLAVAHEGKPWFFVGDIHGDFLAWHRLFERVRCQQNFRLCFLGDLVDRGPLGIECFAALLEAVEQYPGQILWVLGNHDEAVSQGPGPGKPFTSSVAPAEFVDFLNEAQEKASPAQLRAWGNLFIEVCRRLPRAVLFGDGLLVTHGGVPLPDRWATLKTLEAFHHPRTLADFTWTRATNYPARRGWKHDPARRDTSSSFEFGYKDLEGFCQAVETVFPVKRVMRGHDHVENGAEVLSEYKAIPILTLNGFGFHYLSNSTARYRPKLTLGIAQDGKLPRIEEVPYLPDELSGIYPTQ